VVVNYPFTFTKIDIDDVITLAAQNVLTIRLNSLNMFLLIVRNMQSITKLNITFTIHPVSRSSLM